MDRETILGIQDLRLTLGERVVLDHLSMDVWRGYAHAIIGPNGAGKSTLASTIMGLSGYRRYSGSIVLDNEPIDALSIQQRASRGITMAWQEPARFEGISVRSFVTLNTAGEDRDGAAREALAAVGFDPEEYLDRRVDKTLSGGERKRIELASILTIHPRLVLMDEPDSGIDIEALQRIFEVVELLKRKGVTVLLITHSGAVLERADHAFLLCCGRVVEKGAVNKIAHFFNDRCIPCDHKNRPEKTRQ